MRKTLGSLRRTLINIDDRLTQADTGQMDLLQDHLARARASGGVFARTVTAPPWGLRLPGTIQLALHAVIQGRAWLWLDAPRAATELAPGELALVRGGPDHHIAHEPAAPCLDPAEFKARHARDEHRENQRATVFVCGAYRFSGDVAELAAVSGLSRAAFARSFQQALGQAPMQYLTGWRMTLARDYLRTGQPTLAQVADHTGYASPYAFAAAFRR